MLLALDAVMLPVWAIVAIVVALLVGPKLSAWIRPKSQAISDVIDKTDDVLLHKILIPAIQRADTTGMVAAAVEELAAEHGHEEHPTIKKVTG